jgi:hypothetical protein
MMYNTASAAMPIGSGPRVFKDDVVAVRTLVLHSSFSSLGKAAR